jgi:hypothetical protein
VDRPAFSMASQFGALSSGPWAAVECTRIPPVIFPPPVMGHDSPPPKHKKLDTLGYPLITASDAHCVEHVGRRPFELDIEREELLPGGPGECADLDALQRALQKRERC